jgi:hypothetical protein
MAGPKKPEKLIDLNETSQRLGVDVETLLKWNESNIFKANITSEGKIGYYEDQINQFLQIKNPKRVPSQTSTRENSSKKGFFSSLLNWMGYKFYEDEYIKTYLRSQVRESLTLTVRPPSKKTISATITTLLVLFISLFTQQGRIRKYSKKTTSHSQRNRKRFGRGKQT